MLQPLLHNRILRLRKYLLIVVEVIISTLTGQLLHFPIIPLYKNFTFGNTSWTLSHTTLERHACICNRPITVYSNYKVKPSHSCIVRRFIMQDSEIRRLGCRCMSYLAIQDVLANKPCRAICANSRYLTVINYKGIALRRECRQVINKYKLRNWS